MRPQRHAVAGVGLLVAACTSLTLATGAVAQAATSAGCYPKSSRTVVKSAIARVFVVSTKREARTYGCLLKDRRAYLLARQRQTAGSVDVSPEPTLAGRFVAYRWTNVKSGQDYPPFELRVFDLLDAEVSRVARFPDNDQYAVAAFVVNRRGGVAWTQVDRLGMNTSELMDMRVYRRDSRGEAPLDFSSRDGTYMIDARSLTIHDRGRRIDWDGTRCAEGRCAAEPRTASLR